MKYLLLAIIPFFLFCYSDYYEETGSHNNFSENRCCSMNQIKIVSHFPQEKYSDLGIVSASDLAGDMNDLLKELREKAYALCADAVIVDSSVLSNTGYKRNLTGVAIKRLQ
jgi:hypothetical protein